MGRFLNKKEVEEQRENLTGANLTNANLTDTKGLDN